jgi:hypothetical protein
MRIATMIFSGVFLITALAASALPLRMPQTDGPAVKVQAQEKKAEKKKKDTQEPAKPAY